MKSKLGSLIQVLFALVVLAGLFWVVYLVLSRAAAWIVGLRTELGTAIIAAAATVIVAVLSIGLGKYFERRDAIDRENRLKKIPLYEQLISFMFRVLQQGKPGIDVFKDGELVQTYSGLTEKMIVWGSDDVLKAYGDFRDASLAMSEERGLVKLMVALENLMLAVRKDLGFANARLVQGSILRLFINDLAKYKGELKAGKRERPAI